MTLPLDLRVAVVGATGAVGRVMLEILDERKFPASEIVPLASSRSVGRSIPFGSSLLIVKELSEEALKGIDLVLLDTPDEIALEWAPIAVRAGALVVDNSAAWRMDPTVPLIVPEINAAKALEHSGIIASPNCTTIGVVVPLAPLHAKFIAEKVIVSSYQATSGAGQAGVDELKDQVAKLHDDLDSLGSGTAEQSVPKAEVFAATIAFNAVPLVGRVKDEGFTSEEWKLLYETQKILGSPDLDVTATCVRVSTVVGHGSSVFVRFREKVSAREATEILSAARGVTVVDVPNPLMAAGTDDCYVGRIRSDVNDPRSLWFFSVSDNLRKGAALNAIQIAELFLPKQ